MSWQAVVITVAAIGAIVFLVAVFLFYKMWKDMD